MEIKIEGENCPFIDGRCSKKNTRLKRLGAHSRGGITDKDFKLARLIDAKSRQND
jgi:hypothetical protein